VTLSIFLFFTSGFGVQYTVMVLPLLFAVWPGMANAYGLVADCLSGSFTGALARPSLAAGFTLQRDVPVAVTAIWVGCLGMLGYYIAKSVARGQLPVASEGIHQKSTSLGPYSVRV